MFDAKSDPPTPGKMVGVFFKLAVPSIITNFMGQLTMFINTGFAGRMNDPTKLAAVGLGSVCTTIMIAGFLIGVNSAQETLTSQAFGAGNIHLCGVYLNRGRYIIIFFFLILAIIPACFAEDILIALGQDREVSRLTSIQIWYSLPSVFFYG